MSQFSIKKIFDNPEVNALLDRMYYEITTAVPSVSINESLCLTGRAAAELQGAAALPCDNLVFATNSFEIIEFVRKSMAKLLNARAIYFQERIIFYFDNLVLEVWPQVESLNIRLYSGVYVQLLADINPILL